MLLCGIYKGEMLISADTVRGNVKTDGGEAKEPKFSADSTGCDKLKIVLVNDNGSMMPLCEAYIK